ncbi:S8 family serine peptidase [Caballeronia sp. NCTM1]|uniref:S8 family peptidase n=1 Tax=Caballeronia sp. NCTM1 TaxID=2921753 RepID=UPI00202775E0|nr:S8 family serine peptidase [Caballeronia sp. NCTM1]
MLRFCLLTGLFLTCILDWANAEEYSWHTSGLGAEITREEFSTLFANIRIARSASRPVPTRVIPLENTDLNTINNTLKNAKIYGGKFPDELGSLVCELNTSYCSLSQRGGKTISTWKKAENIAIRVPDVSMEADSVIRVYKKSAGDRIENIIVKDREGCETFDAACRDLVKKLNDDVTGKKLAPSYEGNLLVPSKSFTSKISSDFLSEPGLATPGKGSAASNSGVAGASQTQLYLDKDIKNNILMRLSPLGPQAVSSTADDTPAKLDRDLLSKLISNVNQKSDRTEIGLMDGVVDVGHCDFAQDIQVLANDFSALDRSPMKCGSVVEIEPEIRKNHGTHVAGLLAAKRGALSGTGINPDAKIFVVSFDVWALRTDAEHKHAQQLLDQLLRAGVKIINLSWSYEANPNEGPGNSDLISQTIRSTGATNTKLFVVAAGDQGMKYDHKAGFACIYLPACLGAQPNVLVVSSLTSSERAPQIPMLGKKLVANWGGDVHLGVPAVNVMSSIWGNQMGRMSGTSQAAPVAAAAASLLLGKRALSASQLKNRLIYTSDLFPSLDGKMFGGRLNISAAVDMNAANVKTLKGDKLNGAFAKLRIGPPLTKPGSANEAAVTFERVETGEPIAVSFDNIRRLHRRSDIKDAFDLFYIENTVLKREKVRIQPGFLNHQNAYLQIGDKVRTVYLDDVADYIAAVPAPKE